MKTFLYLIILFFLTSCSADKGVYWCGDHSCINKKEKEAYFKKTMIVEIKNLEKKTSENNLEVEKIIQQAKKEEKNITKQAKLEEKRKKKEEKNITKQAKLEEKRKKKEEKNLAKQTKRDEARIIKKEKKKSKQSVNINPGIESATTISTNFIKLVEKIKSKNIFRPYPDINDIPN